MRQLAVESGAMRSRVIAWTDPAIVYAVHARISSLELFQAMQSGDSPMEPAISLLGAELHHVAMGETALALKIGEQHLDHSGHVQPGILAVLADTAAGYAVHTLLPIGGRCASLELNLNLAEPVPLSAGTVIVTGQSDPVGDQIVTCVAVITDTADRYFGSFSMTMIVI